MSIASTWSYLKQTINRNPGLWILAGLGLWGLVQELRRSDTRHNEPIGGPRIALLTYALLQVFLYLQHTTKFPYIFINIAPTLSLLGVFGLLHIQRMIVNPGRQSLTKLLGLAFGILLPIVVLGSGLAHHYRHSSPSELKLWQEQTMNLVEHLTQPSDPIFDGVGMVVTRQKATKHSMTLRWFTELEDPASFIQSIADSESPIVISNYRINRVPIAGRLWIQNRYMRYWGNVLVAGTSLNHSNPTAPTLHQIFLPATIRYKVVSEGQASIKIDGHRMVEEERVLLAGPHEVEVQGEPGQVFIVHAAAIDFSPPSGPGLARQIFASYSD